MSAMKNLSNTYMNHPELVWIFLVILLLSMFLLPLWQCNSYRKKQNTLKKLAEKSVIVSEEEIKDKSVCTFCKSQRVIEEVIYVSPLSVKYALFFPRISGTSSLIQFRCGSCGTKLFSRIKIES